MSRTRDTGKVGKTTNAARRRADVSRRSLVATPESSEQPPTASIAAPLTWERALDTWRDHLRSEQTRVTYLSAARAFAKQLGPLASTPLATSFTVETLDAYAGSLAYRCEREVATSKRLSPATVNLKLAALRSFLTFARRRRWLPADIDAQVISDALTGIPSHVQRPYQIVDGVEVDGMLDAAARDPYDGPRLVALVALALGAGLRVAELCALDVGDLATDATSCYVDVRQGKGHKDRQVPIASDVYALVLAYLDATGRAVWSTADRATPLFRSRNLFSEGSLGRLSVRRAQRLIQECAARAGMTARGKRITPHALRHSYAIHVLKGDPSTGQPGAPLPAVAKLLGHSSVAITGRYLAHFERGELAEYAPHLRAGKAPATPQTGPDGRGV